ncbi:hypothetical protein [Streptomyces thermolilacinus]|uniref:Holin-X, holin superfamily III n=1 Tax=Streptomyces thermolilacinus SPC6 TaxID=1306406 RepID=A0A1D3DZE8_9ACTN|nr:hypothetical protein [Streptomyces thermolilacinus]OEJ97678.1 hypothetical protein J116_027740 [Streptomyces thermolilacinus SPC6]
MPESAENVLAVVVEEAMNVREELGGAVAEAVGGTRSGLSALAAGGACGLLAALMGHAALQERLARAWSPEAAAAALALTYATSATALVTYGKARLRRARAASREALDVSRDAVARTADELAHG